MLMRPKGQQVHYIKISFYYLLFPDKKRERKFTFIIKPNSITLFQITTFC